MSKSIKTPSSELENREKELTAFYIFNDEKTEVIEAESTEKALEKLKEKETDQKKDDEVIEAESTENEL